MSIKTMFIIYSPMQPAILSTGSRVDVGGIELGTVTCVDTHYDGVEFKECIYVEWDECVELGSFHFGAGRT